jgi:hypothetical protein
MDEDEYTILGRKPAGKRPLRGLTQMGEYEKSCKVVPVLN